MKKQNLESKRESVSVPNDRWGGRGRRQRHLLREIYTPLDTPHSTWHWLCHEPVIGGLHDQRDSNKNASLKWDTYTVEMIERPVHLPGVCVVGPTHNQLKLPLGQRLNHRSWKYESNALLLHRPDLMILRLPVVPDAETVGDASIQWRDRKLQRDRAG